MSYEKSLLAEKEDLANTPKVLADILAYNEDVARLQLELFAASPGSFNLRFIVARMCRLVTELQNDWAQKEANAEANQDDREAYYRERAAEFARHVE